MKKYIIVNDTDGSFYCIQHNMPDWAYEQAYLFDTKKDAEKELSKMGDFFKDPGRIVEVEIKL